MKIRLVARVPLLVASLAIAVSEQEQRDAGGWHKAIFRVEDGTVHVVGGGCTLIEHLCVYRVRKTPDADIENEIVRLFQELRGDLEGLLEMSVGINTTEEVEYLKGFTVGLRMLFDSRRSLKNYLDHPKHRAVADFVLKSVDDVIVCDFEV